jgi:hypothetical protein
VACDSPARQCLEWHIKPRLSEPRASGDGKGYRALCPAHDDRKHSLSIGIGDGGGIAWQCFAGCDQLAVRAGLISSGVRPGCLPVSRARRDDLVDQLWQILGSGGKDHAIVRLRIAAALDGRKKLPHGDELAALASRAGVSRRTAFNAREASTDNPSS